jgi:16S rRNA (cytosine967-C5)-methyltransferase
LLRDAWALAIETLSWIELQRLGERLALNKAARQLEIEDSKTIGLAHKLVCETIRAKNLVDYLLNSVLTPRSLKDFKLGLRAFLRLYTYETQIAGHDFKKAVDMARIGRSILGWREFSEVEEILGKILNVQPNVLLKGVTDKEKIGLSTYNPLWFVKYCFKMFGRKEALEYLESYKEIPPTYIRINTLKASEETLLKNIESDHIVLEKIQQLKYAYKLKKSRRPLTRTQSFRDGFFFIQDKASCLSVEVANPRHGATVLDVCAAPGAKTTYLAQLMENKGTIYSVDYSKRRMKVWKRETERMSVQIAIPVIADARKPLPVKVLADLVVLDPPCTSTGAFGKIPSAKWRLTKRSVLGMAKLQWEMLNQCVDFVKDGGFLVYSTCSITLEENEMLIERFLKWHPEFTSVETTPKIGLPGLRGQNKCQRLYPHLHECNGFFVAKLLKEG